MVFVFSKVFILSCQETLFSFYLCTCAPSLTYVHVYYVDTITFRLSLSHHLPRSGQALFWCLVCRAAAQWAATTHPCRSGLSEKGEKAALRKGKNQEIWETKTPRVMTFCKKHFEFWYERNYLSVFERGNVFVARVIEHQIHCSLSNESKVLILLGLELN